MHTWAILFPLPGFYLSTKTLLSISMESLSEACSWNSFMLQISHGEPKGTISGSLLNVRLSFLTSCCLILLVGGTEWMSPSQSSRQDMGPGVILPQDSHRVLNLCSCFLSWYSPLPFQVSQHLAFSLQRYRIQLYRSVYLGRSS